MKPSLGFAEGCWQKRGGGGAWGPLSAPTLHVYAKRAAPANDFWSCGPCVPFAPSIKARANPQ